MTPADQTRTAQGQGWLVVGLLSALLVMSMVDRTSLSAVAQPLMRDLGLTDSQLGMLVGFAFAAVYAIVSYPVAYILDFGHRIRLVAIGAIVWGGASIAAGFAFDFTSLAICRGILAVAEAVLTPAALSLIPDLFATRKRALPLAIFSAMPPISLPVSLLIGGLALSVGSALQPSVTLAPWRLALCILGLPSMVLGGVLWATCREPVRLAVLASSSDDIAGATANHFLQEWRFYGGYLIALSAIASAFLGTAIWLPTAMVRAFGVDPAYAAKTIGLYTLPATVLGTILWPLCVSKLEQRGLISARGAVLVLISIALLLIAMTLLQQSFSGVVLTFACMSFIYGGVPVSVAQNLMTLAPPRLRARAGTIVTFGGGVIATGVGPLLVATIGEHVRFEGGKALLLAITIVWGALGFIAAIAFALGLDRLRPAIRREIEMNKA